MNKDWQLGRWERVADPLADDTVALLMGTAEDAQGKFDLDRLRRANAIMGAWSTNGSLDAWVAGADKSDPIQSALVEYARVGLALPDWADRAKIERAETLFMDYGPLSCTLLFCASLPECYLIPDLAEVLHIAGQLEEHTEHRIRQTAAMVFPVMLKGGLTDADGSGVVSVLRVRLIHATIRHLIVRGNPSKASGVVPKMLRTEEAPAGLQAELIKHGWNVDVQGLPCNQVELAYTLLTFGYVFLRGLRQLGLPLTNEDERAVLHAWNVMGHILGIHRDLMADTMDDAEELFTSIASSARLHAGQFDARPGLGKALMAALSNSIRVPWIRQFPVPMARWLVGEKTADAVGITEHLSFGANVAFRLSMGLARGIDSVVRIFVPGFALSRMLVRIVGYHMLTRFLLDQTRPLALPDRVLNPLKESVASWSDDKNAPGWVNRVEDRLTTHGTWVGDSRE